MFLSCAITELSSVVYIGIQARVPKLSHVVHQKPEEESKMFLKVSLKPTKVWLSYRQIKYRGYQQHFTAYLTNKDEKRMNFEYAN